MSQEDNKKNLNMDTNEQESIGLANSVSEAGVTVEQNAQREIDEIIRLYNEEIAQVGTNSSNRTAEALQTAHDRIVGNANRLERLGTPTAIETAERMRNAAEQSLEQGNINFLRGVVSQGTSTDGIVQATSDQINVIDRESLSQRVNALQEKNDIVSNLSQNQVSGQDAQLVGKLDDRFNQAKVILDAFNKGTRQESIETAFHGLLEISRDSAAAELGGIASRLVSANPAVTFVGATAAVVAERQNKVSGLAFCL